MVLQNVLHMNVGNGESSYASNSTIQKTIILKARQVLEETLNEYGADGFPKCFKIADFGCSSGPNTLFVVSNIIDNVHAICQEKSVKSPEFQVFLNDLPNNDFNTIFKMLPSFFAKLREEKGEKFGPCFISGVPGSFYGRLFPSTSLHFVHSSYSLHWLSQVPKNLENNKENIYMSRTSPPGVFEAYANQFLRDFSAFLSMRAEEIIPNGRMVLTVMSRSISDPTSEDCCCLWDLLANSLHDMEAEGLVGEADINSFNIPLYTPCMDEVKAIIQSEGSFSLSRLELFRVKWDIQEDEKQFMTDCEDSSGMVLAKRFRAGIEPLLVNHFGNSFIDNLFDSFARHVDEHLSRERTSVFFNFVISLTKK